MRILTVLLIVTFMTSACTPKRHGAKGAADTTPQALASAAPPPAEPADPAKPKPSMEATREGFMQGCKRDHAAIGSVCGLAS